MDNLGAIPFELQCKLNNAEVTIIGSNQTSDFLLANLVGLGIETIIVSGKRNTSSLFGESHKEIKSFFKNLSETAYVDFDEEGISKTEYSVNVSNLLEERKTGDVFGRVNDNEIQISSNVLPINSNNNINLNGICASLCADEIRKRIAPMSNNDNAISNIYFKSKLIPKNTRKNIVVVGAGGTGTYCLTGLLNEEVKVHIFDDDSFEPRNRNRQIFYEDEVKKARRITEFLNEKGTATYIPHEQRLTKKNIDLLLNLKPEVILGCVDNFETRGLLETFSRENNIPYIDSGVNTFNAQIISNSKIFSSFKSKKTESCALKPNPSIIIPNSIAGFQLARCYNCLDENSEYSFVFDSFDDKRIGERYDNN